MRFYAFYVCSVYCMFYAFRSICTSKRLGNQHVIKLNNDNINSEDLAQRIQGQGNGVESVRFMRLVQGSRLNRLAYSSIIT